MPSRIRMWFVILAVFCTSVSVAHADLTAEERLQLQQQLSYVQMEIQQNQAQLETQQKQRTTLERDVAIINSKIQAAQLAIKQRDLIVQQLQDDIDKKSRGIQGLDSKVTDGQASLGQIIRATRQIDDTSMVELVLGRLSLADVFTELDNYQVIQGELSSSFDTVATTRADLTARKEAQEEQRTEQQDLLRIQQLQQDALKGFEQQKQNLVIAARGQEAIYLQVIANKKQTAADIEKTLFALRDTTKNVSFGDMFTYAKEASAKTGVRPAVILAILAEETNLGQNIGTGRYLSDMHPTRDVPVFKDLCEQLKLDPAVQPVSKKAWYGWGGAMGPAQFIPSTWKQYADRISQLSGQSPANPWDPRTATFAAAILMKDNGADARTPAAERLAALRYLAGWKNATKPSYSFYGDAVMDNAAKFQSQIDIIGR